MSKFSKSRVLIFIGTFLSFITFGLLLLTYVMVIKSPMTTYVISQAMYSAHPQKVYELEVLNKIERPCRNINDLKARTRMKYLSDLCKLKIITHNTNKIPREGKVVVISNHPSGFDGWFLNSTIDQIRGNDLSQHLTGTNVGKTPGTVNDMLNIVQEGRWLVPGGREKIDACLQSGNAFVIFPSGNQQALENFKDGFLRFAIDNEADILPVHIELKYPVWMKLIRWLNPELYHAIKGTFLLHFYTNAVVEITFGDVIPFSEVAKDKNNTYTDARGKKRYSASVLKKYQDIVAELGTPGAEIAS